MRLTLRTLLAHLDGVQIETGEPGDLSKKIEESEFVRNLVQRIRTSMSRPRLPAPKIDGQGLGHDPNTVAAYLDNTLPQDRMPDLEKICLESDVLLGEVAASHQILTLVLQNPVKAPPHLRDRIYRIGDLGKTTAAESAAAKGAPTPPPAPAAGDGAAEKPSPRKREIPDYLRETRSLGWKPLALTVVLGFLLAAALLRALGPFDANHPVLGFFVGGTPDEKAVVQRDSGSDNTPQPAVSTSKETSPEESPAEKTSGAAAEANVPTDAAEPSPPATTEQPQVPPSEAPSEGEAKAAAESKTPPAPVETPAEKTPAKTAAPAPSELASTSPTTDAPIPAPILADAPQPAKTAEAPEPAADLGRYISENEVVARYDAGSNAWMRLPPNAPLAFGDRLLALPAFRPKLVLASGFQITLSGGTLVELRGPEAEGAASLGVEYGRIVVVPVGPAAGGVRLDCWGRQGEVTFAGPDSIMAVQLRRYRSPGVNPEAGFAHRMVEIYAVGGNLLWREPGHPEQPIKAGETFAFLDDARGGIAPTDLLPPWVEQRDADRSDALAIADVHLALGYEMPLDRTLPELINHRKIEVKALGTRSLAYLNYFDPLVDSLRDVNQKSYWDGNFDELQRALAREPETAREVRVAIEKVRGPRDGAEVYRLLWSYSPEDLERAAAERLVEYLMSTSLDIRVLAIQNLERITGLTHLYRPELEDARRKAAYQRWRNTLAEGKIRYREENVLMLPPRILEEPAPAETEAPETTKAPAPEKVGPPATTAPAPVER